ncbi:hypothetical protein WA1_41415 [Scytonema hofmannii PCC 7110]|uniref:Uncharacterized protein n=1 Tax=Scytonema hofmannii PCC 7110 TaxID=128403 RepID=A0A139WUT4_9CYAN|nr:hypothetical protein [Scytonema hofmannii]KYC36196.1 hypothetical protein WA1_41415 [Scytonema hofmannii PCC 7110]
MNTQELEKTVYRIKPDIVILDSNELIVLLAQAQADPKKQGDTSEVISWLKSGNGAIPFVMFIDLKSIQIFKWDNLNYSEPVCIFNTVDVLTPYGLKLPDKWISNRFLGTLVESWLGDIRHTWKLDNPPGEEQIKAIGLLTLLKDGETQPEVDIKIHSDLKYIVLRYYHPRPGDI